MKFTAEQLKKINTAKSAEELMALAKAEGIEISEEEIKAKFAEMHKEGEIADDELDNVAGGCGEDDHYYPHIGDAVIYSPTGQTGTVKSIEENYFLHTSNDFLPSITYSTGYKVEFSDGTTVWAEDNQLSLAYTVGWVSF